MRWRKLGLLYAPDGRQEWAQSHAMIPTPLSLSDDILRIYCSHLDRDSVGRIGYLDVKPSEPTRLLKVAQSPVLDIGEPGAFDDNGVVPCCIVPTNGSFHLYYSGFQLQRKIPYTILSGIAVSESGAGPFRRALRVPVLDRTDGELFFRAVPFVMQEQGRWRMWYIGGDAWVHADGKALPTYSLRHLESDDGVRWTGRSTECLAPDRPDEIGFGRPFIIRDGPVYRMWYSVRRTSGYRIGYATSPDGLRWTRRDDEAGIACADSGWDSEMICFSAVVRAEDRWVMFYNGNGYGRTGVGVAVADPDQ